MQDWSLCEFWEKFHDKSLKFGKLTDLVPGVLKVKNSKIKPHTIHYWQFIPLETKLEIAKNQP